MTRSKRHHATDLDTFSSSDDDGESLLTGHNVEESVVSRMAEEDDDKRQEEENDDDDDEDEDDKVENARKARAKKIKELKNKPRICFQVVRRRRECNSNFDSANDDYDVKKTNFFKKYNHH